MMWKAWIKSFSVIAKRFSLFPVDYQVEIDQFTDGRDNPLSDHLAVSMRLDWKWKGKISQNEDEKTAHSEEAGCVKCSFAQIVVKSGGTV